MRLAHVDAAAGATGPMLLGALVSAGLSSEGLQALVGTLAPTARVEVIHLVAGGVPAVHAEIACQDKGPQTWQQVLALLDASALPERVLLSAKKILAGWAAAHAAAHGLPPASRYQAPLSLPDVLTAVAFMWGLDQLGVDQLSSSPLPMGRGGSIQPVTAELLRGFPVLGVEPDVETVTPVAAAILAAWAVNRGPLPPMTLQGTGYGAPPQGWPLPGNLRLWLGDGQGDGLEARQLLMLEANIDDMNPEFYDHVMAQLLEAGALDVNLVPMQMKKNRPAILLRVLCAPDCLVAARDLILRETTTLGVRVHQISRYALARRFIDVETPWGAVRVKVARLPDGTPRPIPEYEDCRRLAQKGGVPLWLVHARAQAIAWEQLQGTGEE